MIMGMMAAQMRAAGGGLPWTPLNMAVVPQIYLDAQDSVVTDVAGACSAISNLGSLGSGGDFAQDASTRRPAIIAAGQAGRRILRFDGVDDWMFCASTPVRGIFRAKSGAWSFAVYKKLAADASPASRVVGNFQSDTGATRFAHWCGSGTTGKASVPRTSYNAGAGFTTLEGATASYGAYALSLAAVNLDVGSASMYLNGALDATAAATTGAFPDVDGAAGGAVIGARGDAVWLSDMDLAVYIAGNANLTAGEREKLEGWAAHTWGLTANLPGGHPYKTVAPTI